MPLFRIDVDHASLEELINLGLSVLKKAGDSKWNLIRDRVLTPAGDERVVLFAQPIETVSAFAHYLERTYGVRPAVITGGQTDQARQEEIDRFLAAKRTSVPGVIEGGRRRD